jgi:hypothetical protein
MPPRLTQAERDAIADDAMWNAAIAYTRSYNDWRAALREHRNMPFHPEVMAAWDNLLLEQKELKRVRNKYKRKPNVR